MDMITKRKLFFYCICLIILLAQPAEAIEVTIIRIETPPLCVRTIPDGATVRLSSGTGCDSTPCAIEGERKEVVSITIEKEGYKSIRQDIGPDVNGVYAPLEKIAEAKTAEPELSAPPSNQATGKVSARIAGPPDESQRLRILNCQ